MIAPQDIGIDQTVGDLLHQPVGYHKIVDPPSRVVVAGVVEIGPPAVCAGPVGIKGAKAVSKAAVEQLCKLFPFLVSEARIFPIRAGIFRSIS